ncbi:MAG: polysaccharide biosynthesis/export family protein [Bacteroidaceae bacterium]|nr:polysaccharide biosynthesis/export family protein [Bacteroidaceae bacterium]
MKKYLTLVLLAVVLVFASCTSYKNVPYIQNSSEVDLSAATSLYDSKIMPKDILSINVNYPLDPDAVKMFNLTMQSGNTVNSTADAARFSTQVQLQSYLVSNEGTINYPILGEMKVVGMTKTQLEEYIASRIQGNYTREKPIVNVLVSNYKVTVLGEVARGGQYTVTTGKVNIFEALALAGDMTIWGRRDCVKLIRENEIGEKSIVELNLNDANIINSPYYQLQQNDVLYVTPNKAKSKNSGVGSETSLWFTSTSILVSLTSLLYNILK